MSTNYSVLKNSEIDTLIAESLGWVKISLHRDLFVTDDGCLFGGKCDACGEHVNMLHSVKCLWLERRRVWIHPDVARWEDTDEPKRYHQVITWKPTTSIEKFEVIKREIEKRGWEWISRYRPAAHRFSEPVHRFSIWYDHPTLSIKDESRVSASTEQRAGRIAFLLAIKASKIENYTNPMDPINMEAEP